MKEKTCLSIVLAAGEGTRMRSTLPKVLHLVAGRSLLAHVLDTVREAGGTATAVVIGPGHEAVAAEARRFLPEAEIHVQDERRGTGHAVLMAKAAVERGADDVVVIFGDTPLIRAQTLRRLRGALADGAAVAVLGFSAADPTGYGRLITDQGQLIAIREHKDATATERSVVLCNGGLMALAGKDALRILQQIGNDNSKKEFYLSDAVAVARKMGLKTAVIEAEEDEVRGINTKAQLAEAETVLQQRLRQAALDAGVTMTAPETVFLAADTRFGRDVVIEPYVVFGPGVVVEDGAVIHAFSHLAGAQVGKGASVGPFARLRPGARLGEKSRVGNFVEVKEADIGAGAKANHLAYIGDATVGAEANIGAGTIFCNYDGQAKHHTEVGRGVFIGSNSALVSPVQIGEGAYVATGSVITENVPGDALVFGRARQVVKENRAAALRKKAAAGKKAAEPPG
jgi:bifunctional UDP-N-acetylglucosamine pyrophosphorylase / glucosamine-1-phosphate N-acetyltransferase